MDIIKDLEKKLNFKRFSMPILKKCSEIFNMGLHTAEILLQCKNGVLKLLYNLPYHSLFHIVFQNDSKINKDKLPTWYM